MEEHGLGIEIEGYGRPSRFGRLFVGLLLLILLVSVLVLSLCQDWEDGASPVKESALDAFPTSHVSRGAQVAVGHSGPASEVRSTSRSPGREPDVSLTRGPRPGSERAYYLEFEKLAHEDRAAFLTSLREAWARRPVAAGVAGLRVAHDLGVGKPFAFFVEALQNDELSEDLREFALRFVTERARSKDARAALKQFLDGDPVTERHRAEATYALVRWGDSGEVAAACTRMFAESAPGVVSRGVQALEEVGSPRARAAISELRTRHPTATVRAALAIDKKRGGR